MERLLEVCNPRLYSVVACALTTGMRKSEILGLRWENVDLERGTIYVLKTKSGKERRLPITSKLRNVLTCLGAKQQGPVFEMAEITFRRLFDTARKDSGLPHFRWHDLRHTFASNFVMKTGNLPALQKILGHATPEMVLRYAHHSKSHLAVEMELADSALPSLRQFDAPAAVGHQMSHQATEAASTTDCPISEKVL